MRVSDRHRFLISTNRIEDAKEQNAKVLKQFSSQRRINLPHDDPVGASQALKHTNRLADLQSLHNNLQFSKGFLSVTESALSTIQENLNRAKELSIGMASDTFGPDARASTAKEIGEIVNSIIQMGNSRFGAKYVFSGFRTSAPAFDRDGVFLGDDGEIFLQTGEGKSQRINFSGRELFEASAGGRSEDTTQMIDSLLILKRGMEENNKETIQQSLERIDRFIDKAASMQASVGAITNTLSEAEKQLGLKEDLEKEQLAVIEDVDMFSASSDFKRSEQVLQSVLLTSSKMLQPSLFNFLQ
ncbi:MAG: flagellar hook-associated protein FlgL [Deltaproteobacteria bacterium]|nr:flagellar hook-associated protein FlgL [Deltaproteobacteria bacterium]